MDLPATRVKYYKKQNSTFSYDRMKILSPVIPILFTYLVETTCVFVRSYTVRRVQDLNLCALLGAPHFECGALDHSANPPHCVGILYPATLKLG